MLAEATGSLEALALEHRHRAVVEKRPGDRAALGVLGIALHGASPEPRDLVQSARERGGGDPAAPVLPVDEEAGDPPIRKGDETVEVRAAALDARQLVGRPALTPADAPRAVVPDRGGGPPPPPPRAPSYRTAAWPRPSRTRASFSARFCATVFVRPTPSG